ncbi:structural protein [Pseudomonas sp. Pdm06]|uniref:structural protein n=1 Tax=Pseudomonas sp. Pdm06 TaxID=1790044 RepID=UPI00177BB569|nr:structural protein [Pseudomonas sp. Pdm06]MBD9463934.1 structural protein [Pseudomonas sp. Pdm06]
MRPEHPRGIRNYNPGNIRHAHRIRWQGMSTAQTDSQYVQYINPRWGIRAIARVLITYQDKHRAADGSPIDTVREIIERWAPPSENNTDAYIISVARALGLDPDVASVDVYDFDIMRALVTVIIRHENGPGPLPGGRWYGDAIIADGLSLAGIERGIVHGQFKGAPA